MNKTHTEKTTVDYANSLDTEFSVDPYDLFRDWLICVQSPKNIACVAGVIGEGEGEGEGERGRREKMRGIGERGEGTPATRTPFASFLRSLANANF